uniref:Fibrinogen C-terminal domain-containing protein n=1 Tax=Latimeria chalumnae TaxID=7897 RepID=H3BAN9_LATCH
SGVYTILPIGVNSTYQVYCEMKGNTGWTVIQKHNGEASLDFDRDWEAYKHGFGNLSSEHWLGLKIIHALTNQAGKRFKLWVDLESFDGDIIYAEYSDFWIGDEASQYKLHLGGYLGNRGDAFRGAGGNQNQEGQGFSTYDRDNDGCSPCFSGRSIARNHCSRSDAGGWWFNSCGSAYLNGKWHPKGSHIGKYGAIYWKTWDPIQSLKSTVTLTYKFNSQTVGFLHYQDSQI